MATNTTSFIRGQRNLRGFTAVLTSAACEWLLIFLLLIEAVLSYLLTRFARYCELQIPCIFCSRLDHVLGYEKPGFCWNLLCSTHRSEVSSLIFCDNHGKLADGHGMCETCLLSFIAKNKHKPDTNRLIFGKLAFDFGGWGPNGLHTSFLNKDIVPVSKDVRLCLCCNKPWAPKQRGKKPLQLISSGLGVAKPNIPLPRRLGRRDSLKKIREKFSGPVGSRRLGKSTSDPLSHVGYTELKINSESETEVLFSDDDGSSSVVHDTNKHKEDSIAQCATEIPHKKLSKDLASLVQPDCSEPRDAKCLVPDDASESGFCERKGQQTDQKIKASAVPELISLDDNPAPLSDVEVPFVVSAPQKSNPSAISDLISLVDTPLPFDVKEVPLGSPLENSADVVVTSEPGNVSVNNSEEILKLISTFTEADSKTKQLLKDPAALNSTFEDANDVYKSVVGAKESEASRILAEQSPMNYHNRANEDSKLLLVQNTPEQGNPSSFNNTSPRLQDHGAELQITDESNSDGIQNLQNSAIVDRTESTGLESLDGSSVSEIEGESIVDNLKRQIEHDRRCISSLYKELEEERNASTIAANQAMAMITRLQEEKAALHMEALQYLRMMEEQAEYDVDALQKANDLLAEKEKEIQDLEAEIELYRLNLGDESLVGRAPAESVGMKEKKDHVKNTIPSCKNDSDVPHKSMFAEDSEDSHTPVVISSFSELEDEKLYISQCLKSLERKIHQFSHHGTSPYISDCEYSIVVADGGYHEGEFRNEKAKRLSCQMEDNGLTVQKDQSVSNKRAPMEKGSNVSIEKDKVVSKENGRVVSNGQSGTTSCRESDLFALENEISDLNERLEALEDDCNFLEHSINSLQNEDEGLQFVQEIAYQLRELRKIGIRSRRRSVSWA